MQAAFVISEPAVVVLWACSVCNRFLSVCLSGNEHGRDRATGAGGGQTSPHLWFHSTGRLHLLDRLAASQHRARPQTHRRERVHHWPAAWPHGPQGHWRAQGLRWVQGPKGHRVTEAVQSQVFRCSCRSLSRETTGINIYQNKSMTLLSLDAVRTFPVGESQTTSQEEIRLHWHHFHHRWSFRWRSEDSKVTLMTLSSKNLQSRIYNLFQIYL